MLKERLNAYITQSGKSKSSISKEIGISAPALTNYLNDRYGAKDLSSIEGKISSWLDKQAMRNQLPEPVHIDFMETEVSGVIFEVADYCRLRRRIGVVVGEAGVGKTTAIRQYSCGHNDVIVIYGHKSMTMRWLFKRLAIAVGADDRGTTSALFERIVERLGDRLLIVDEAEHLTAPMLDELRRLNDREFGGSGLLLIGLPRFLEMIRSRQYDYAYLRTRIAQSVIVTNLGESDIRNMVTVAFPDFANDEVCKCFYKLSRGNPRRLVKLLEASWSVAQQNGMRVIGTQVIESAATYVCF